MSTVVQGVLVQRVLVRRVLTPVTVALFAVTMAVLVVRLAGHTIPLWIQVIPFAVSILVFGLPHGALDHLVPARLDPGLGVRRSLVLVGVIYLIVGGATALLWITVPPLGFAAFIALTWFHWGQGDLYIDHLLAEGPATRLDAAITVALRGALPMLLPLVAYPGEYARVFEETVRAVAPGSAVGAATIADMGAFSADALRVAAAVIVGVLMVVQLAVRARSKRPIRRIGIEIAVVTALFLVVPPVLAVGLYFTLWHSVRHILRLELTDPVSAAQLGEGRIWRPLVTFFRQAWPITLIAVLILVIVAAIVQQANLGVYLVVIAALTTPHAVVVTLMDFRQKSWRPVRA